MTASDPRHVASAIRAGLAGYPIGHSLSPRLFAAAADSHGLDCRYELLSCHPGEFPRTVAACRAQGFHGISVTTPHKRSAWELADSHSEEARLCGNANLLLFREDGIHAANTDVDGFCQALTSFAGFDARSQRCVILGCGSVAASVTLGLARLGCRSLVVAARNATARQKFGRLAGELCAGMELKLHELDSQPFNDALATADLLVNCSSAGMAGREDESPLGGVYTCRRDLLALDLVYHPPVTRFIAQMRNCGARTENGLAMLACQAAAAFELMCDRDVDPGLLLASLEEN